MKRVGLNLRLTTTFLDLVQQAQQFGLSRFQSFLTSPGVRQYSPPSSFEYQQFSIGKAAREFYIHGSYCINLAHESPAAYTILKKELMLAKKLECTYFILHPGAAAHKRVRDEGIDTIAKHLNRLLKTDIYPPILLENVAFGERTIGGNLADLSTIQSKLDKPECVQFCIDTAHAYGYGYDIASAQGQNSFIKTLQETVGIHAIALIHLNDTKAQLGTKIDHHEVFGAGTLGYKSLKQFALNPHLTHIPLILELPIVPEETVHTILKQMSSWCT